MTLILICGNSGGAASKVLSDGARSCLVGELVNNAVVQTRLHICEPHLYISLLGSFQLGLLQHWLDKTQNKQCGIILARDRCFLDLTRQTRALHTETLTHSHTRHPSRFYLFLLGFLRVAESEKAVARKFCRVEGKKGRKKSFLCPTKAKMLP